MCGRYSIQATSTDLQEAFPEFRVPDGISPRYNIAPTQEAPALLNDGSGEVVMLRWGLIPSWAKDPTIGNRMINARAETVAEKPSFRTALRKRRCLLLADGFYEWYRSGPKGPKIPVLIRLKSGRPFTFAGLWETWRPPDKDSPLRTFTIITTAANELLQPVHPRMPVMAPPQSRAVWLSNEPISSDDLADILRPYPADEMTFHTVSRVVNSPRNDGPECVQPTGPADQLPA